MTATTPAGGRSGHPPTVLHCVSWLDDGGINGSLLSHIPALEDRGTFRHVVCSVTDRVPWQHRYEELGIEVISLGHQKRTDLLSTVRRAHQALGDLDVAIVHSHMSLSQRVLGVAARLHRVPHVVTIHFPPSSARSMLGRPERALTDQYLAVSGQIRDRIGAVSGVSPSDVEVITNGLTRTAPAARTSPEVLRRSLGIEPGAPLLLNVGRLATPKNQAELIEAFALVAAARPAARLAIAGEGPLRPDLERRVRHLGLEDQVILLGSRTDVGDLYRAADIVVQPSLAEGWSVAILEAMRLGRPIVASAIPPTQAMLEPDAGVVVPLGDPPALSDALLRTIADPVAAGAMGQRAEARFASDFTADHAAAAFDRVYTRLARRHPVAPSSTT